MTALEIVYRLTEGDQSIQEILSPEERRILAAKTKNSGAIIRRKSLRLRSHMRESDDDDISMKQFAESPLIGKWVTWPADWYYVYTVGKSRTKGLLAIVCAKPLGIGGHRWTLRREYLDQSRYRHCEVTDAPTFDAATQQEFDAILNSSDYYLAEDDDDFEVKSFAQPAFLPGQKVRLVSGRKAIIDKVSANGSQYSAHCGGDIVWLKASDIAQALDDTLEVSGQHGVFTVDKQTGKIISHDQVGEEDGDGDNYSDIALVDVREYAKTYGNIPDAVDILDIGYWLHNGTYESPEMEWRRERDEERR